MRTLIATALLALTALAGLPTLLALTRDIPLSHPVNGECTYGYIVAGDFCTPAPDLVRKVIPKPRRGGCPETWVDNVTSCMSPPYHKKVHQP